MNNLFEKIVGTKYGAKHSAADWIKYIGPGFMVTVGFIDPGNWATNVAAGASYGYKLLWIIPLSTIMLMLLQHNAAHLGIVTGDCLAEAASRYLKPWVSRLVLASAMLAAISTALAELLGAAIALNMLFKIPLAIGVVFALCFTMWMLFKQVYRKIEKWIIGFVSLIGISFVVELLLVPVGIKEAAIGTVVPTFPPGAMLIIVGVLGAVVMPHNLFLHSEVIQSRQIDRSNEREKQKLLDYEFLDTLISMIVGLAINCAMIILAAATFYAHNIKIDDLSQVEVLLTPIAGKGSAVLFALALLCSGLASSVTCGLAGGCIFAGIYSEPYDIKDRHTRFGILITMVPAVILIWLLKDPFAALIQSQALLSLQLPITIFLLISLTSSSTVMGAYRNARLTKVILWATGLIVIALNIGLLLQMVGVI